MIYVTILLSILPQVWKFRITRLLQVPLWLLFYLHTDYCIQYNFKIRRKLFCKQNVTLKH
jgi:hypothetical protein